MASPELRGIYIDSQRPSFLENREIKASISSSGVSSAAASITSNTNCGSLPRKRNTLLDGGDLPSHSQFDDFEMEKIRQLMSHMDGDRRASGSSISSSHRGSIEPSLMSTVFAVVLVIIISISVYAFVSLFTAVRKRMYVS
ncbi:unnamed protein product [Orchesella dallaii]|uniref:Uncharacterized protein n=1 Tax=Orchesella dallaii TaxID=48710 RepID=A0ABP1QKQ8_9HEXA